jgi:hypothetical protein
MPIYVYENKKTGEVVEVFQSMAEVHEYNGVDGREKGHWRRVFVNPNLSFDTAVDPYDQKSFINSTAGKNDSYGDLFDRSAEASAKRAEKDGKDPIKEKAYSDYNKATNGKLHAGQIKEKRDKAIENANKKGFNVEY